MVAGQQVRHNSRIKSNVARTVWATRTALQSRIHLRPAIALVILFAVARGASSSIHYNDAPSVDSEKPSSISVEANTSNSDQLPESVEIHSSTSESSGTEKPEESVEIKVNGQEVPINPEGTTHQTVTTEGSHTTVDVNIQDGNTSTNMRSTGSTDIQIKSSSRQSISKTERQ